jgi:4-hydroxy 2-oxovalerate aldolase
LKKYSFETAVMLNATDVLGPQGLDKGLLSELFGPQKDSNIQWVRLAVHVDKLKQSIEVVSWLHEQGYQTTVNLMQIGGVGLEEIHEIAEICSRYPQDVLYFADSLGSMTPEDIDLVVTGLRKHWAGALGFHGHNNMERAVQNALRAMALGVEYIDATVLGMGRGPGNLQTEYLAIELENQPNKNINSTPLMSLITKHFQPLKDQYHWGPNPYYYMAGKYGIHPTYVQEMIGNTSYDDEDILAVIHHLRVDGAKRYNYKTMESAKNFFHGQPRGNWKSQGCDGIKRSSYFRLRPWNCEIQRPFGAIYSAKLTLCFGSEHPRSGQ